MQNQVLCRSKFTKCFTREPQTFCLYHSLTQQKVYGGVVLNALFQTFEKPCSCVNAIEIVEQKFPEYSFAKNNF